MYLIVYFKIFKIYTFMLYLHEYLYIYIYICIHKYNLIIENTKKKI